MFETRYFAVFLILSTITGKKLGFHTFGDETEKTKMFDEIGRTLVPGALNDIKKTRKTSVDIFANAGFEKP